MVDLEGREPSACPFGVEQTQYFHGCNLKNSNRISTSNLLSGRPLNLSRNKHELDALPGDVIA